ncbi:MAG TPA: NUDIX hydrolase [Polyangia bacterium]
MSTPAPARPAATIMLLRDGPDGMEVFMVVRHHRIDFASGALVFPGGRVESDDRAIADGTRGGRTPGLDGDTLALRVAGIREAFEECGVLLARPRGARGLIDAARLTSVPPGADFAALLDSEDLELATDLLTPFAHWITPPTMPKRFDTHFFLVPAPSDHLAVHDGAESVDSVWVTPERALAEAAEGRWKLVFPTRLNLRKLARWTNSAAAIEAASAAPIVTVMPEATRTPNGRLMHIPEAAGYGGAVFESMDAPAMEPRDAKKMGGAPGAPPK